MPLLAGVSALLKGIHTDEVDSGFTERAACIFLFNCVGSVSEPEMFVLDLQYVSVLNVWL